MTFWPQPTFRSTFKTSLEERGGYRVLRVARRFEVMQQSTAKRSTPARSFWLSHRKAAPPRRTRAAFPLAL